MAPYESHALSRPQKNEIGPQARRIEQEITQGVQSGSFSCPRCWTTGTWQRRGDSVSFRCSCGFGPTATLIPLE